MEKRKPTYALARIKAEFATVNRLRMTRTAHDSALALAFAKEDVVAVIQGIRSEHFNKSMTAYGDSRRWQDVYFVPVPARALTLYVKFSRDLLGHMVISFKEK